MPRHRIFLIIGIIVSVGALIFLINDYLAKERERIEQEARKKIVEFQTNSVAVLIAKQDIPAGVAVTAEMLDTGVVPQNYLVPQAVTSLDRISGMITIAPIAKGEQISLSKLSYPQEKERGSGLAALTPIGKRAITISVDNIASLAGMLKPGDYVDLFAILTVPTHTADDKVINQQAVIPLFQNVLVLAVGQNLAQVPATKGARYQKEDKTESAPSPLVTLALTPQEANILAFVQEQGKIRLTLRSPADSQIQLLQPATWETLFQYIMPQLPQREEKDIEKETQKEETGQKKVNYIEIYRGLSKETIPLSQQ